VRAQQATYAARQMNGYAKRTRYVAGAEGVPVGGNFEIMQGNAEKLAPEEVQAVVTYLQGMR
jgi:cytochrome c553